MSHLEVKTLKESIDYRLIKEIITLNAKKTTPKTKLTGVN